MAHDVTTETVAGAIPAEGGPIIRVLSRSSRVDVTASDDTGVRVNGVDVAPGPDGAYVLVLRRGEPARVQCPASSRLSICTASGRVSVRGHISWVQVLSATGTVEIEHASDAEVRTASGRVDIGACDQGCRVTTQSGRVQVGSCSDAAVSTATGRVEVQHADRAAIRSVSGRIQVGSALLGTVAAETVSGAVEVTIPAGSSPTIRLKSVTGRVRRDVPENSGESDGAVVAVRSVSGSIRLRST